MASPSLGQPAPRSPSSGTGVRYRYHEEQNVKNLWVSRKLTGYEVRGHPRETCVTTSCGISDRCLQVSIPNSAGLGNKALVVTSFLSNRKPTLPRAPIEHGPKDETDRQCGPVSGNLVRKSKCDVNIGEMGDLLWEVLEVENKSPGLCVT